MIRSLRFCVLIDHLQLSRRPLHAFRREEDLHVFTEEGMILVFLAYLERFLRSNPSEDGVKIRKETLDYAQIVFGKLLVVLNSLRHEMHVPDKE